MSTMSPFGEVVMQNSRMRFLKLKKRCARIIPRG